MNNEKILKAVQVMLQNIGSFSDILQSENEIYFKYKQYVWSIIESTDGDYTLYYYPFAKAVTDVYDYDIGFLGVKFLAHSAKELGAGAQSEFKNLFKTLKSKAYGFDDVLNDIIDDPFAEE